MIMRPVGGWLGFESNLTATCISFPGSRGPPGLPAFEKLGLSKWIEKSHFSLRGLRNGTLTGLPAAILMGPWGDGATHKPWSKHVYSPASAFVTLRIPRVSPSELGSNRKLTATSAPILESEAGAFRVAGSALKLARPVPSSDSSFT